jgi:hypothetical protein
MAENLSSYIERPEEERRQKSQLSDSELAEPYLELFETGSIDPLYSSM